MVREVKEEVQEARLPAEGEVIGVIVQLLGFDRVKVRCSDGKVRICRIPGKMKKKVWLKEGDVVLVAPWDFQADTRGDIILRYPRDKVKELEQLGYLK
ncbi:MAG: translation initiation factor eIF-1A [Candidatus Methanomethylicota archaeon]|uniref:Translation initiation factor 1A n=1 Tax=Thermoproteota archaeon TaxID=2056631 RepID=A0A497ER89_9CREN|nr:MAG: translation initiation factor eIF-1A [Candidatus Verstraetearchaeota archaeon]